MIQLFMENWGRMLGAFVIGVATGWWIWARYSAAAEAEPVRAAPPTPPPPPPPPPPPAPEPEPVVVAPVTATAVPEPEPEPEVEAKRGPKIAAAVGASDDLTRIKGIGPKLNDLCHSLGVRRFDQIAKWNADDVAEVDQYLKIKGRIDRDRWTDQAKLLAAGKDDEHAAEFSLKGPPPGV